jgi:hypothetical protein
MSKDLHIRIIDPAQQEANANLLFWFANPMRVEGLQKLANQWMKLFLTPKGSHPWRRNEGTNFPYLLTGNVADPDALRVAVQEHVEDATTQLKLLQRKRLELPASELLLAVNFLRLTQISDTAFDVWVRIVNVERSTLPVLIPYVRIV